MTDFSRYTSAGIGMARWYFRIGGVLLAAAGAAVWLSTRENVLGSGILVLLGFASFALSFARSGDQVANAAREHLDMADGD